MDPLQPSGLRTPPPAARPWYATRAGGWAFGTAAAVALLAGVAVAVAARTGRQPTAEATRQPSAEVTHLATAEAPRQPTAKATHLATAKATRQPAGAASPAPRGLVSFEHGTDGWRALWGGIRVSPTTQVAYSGSHSLLITTRSPISALGVDNGSVAHLRPGDKVTFHIYSYGQDASVEPFVQKSADSPEDVVESIQLPSRRGWSTVSWVVPPIPGIYAIGTQVTSHGSGRLTLAIDALSWPGS